MQEFHSIPQSTLLWLESILLHGEQASRITKKNTYKENAKHAVELLMKVLQEMDGVP